MNKPIILYKDKLQEDLKRNLNLHKAKYVYALRVFGFGIPIYILVYNSRRPDIPIDKKKIRNFNFFKVLKYFHKYKDFQRVKTSPPLLFSVIEDLLTSNTLIIICDIAGYYLYNKDFYDEK